jgi:hypothetical protein
MAMSADRKSASRRSSKPRAGGAASGSDGPTAGPADGPTPGPAAGPAARPAAGPAAGPAEDPAGGPAASDEVTAVPLNRAERRGHKRGTKPDAAGRGKVAGRSGPVQGPRMWTNRRGGG